MGRKKKGWLEPNGLKAAQTTVHLDRFHDNLLRALQYRTGMSRGEIIREGLDMMGIRWHIDPDELR